MRVDHEPRPRRHAPRSRRRDAAPLSPASGPGSDVGIEPPTREVPGPSRRIGPGRLSAGQSGGGGSRGTVSQG